MKKHFVGIQKYLISKKICQILKKMASNIKIREKTGLIKTIWESDYNISMGIQSINSQNKNSQILCLITFLLPFTKNPGKNWFQTKKIREKTIKSKSKHLNLTEFNSFINMI